MILQKFNLQTYSVFESPNLEGENLIASFREQPTLILTPKFNFGVGCLERD